MINTAFAITDLSMRASSRPSRRGQLGREDEEEEDEGRGQDEDAAHLVVLPLILLRLLQLLEAVLHPDVGSLHVVVDAVDNGALKCRVKI